MRPLASTAPPVSATTSRLASCQPGREIQPIWPRWAQPSSTSGTTAAHAAAAAASHRR
jgi:hypothetical protein